MTRHVVREWFSDGFVVNLDVVLVLLFWLKSRRKIIVNLSLSKGFELDVKAHRHRFATEVKRQQINLPHNHLPM